MAKAPVARYGFIRESNTGKAERYRSTSTGQVVSRRQFDAARRLATLGESTSNENLAKFNREINPEEAASRPARGKTSLRKLAPDVRKNIASSRIAHEKEIAEIEKRKQEERHIARKIEEAKRKKVKVKKISARILKPGSIGGQIDFNSYADYLALYKDAESKAPKMFFSYSIGMVAVNELGRVVRPIVFSRRDFDKPLSENQFYDGMREYMETKNSNSVLDVMYYYMHLSFLNTFAKKHKVTSKQKVKPRKQRTLKKKK